MADVFDTGDLELPSQASEAPARPDATDYLKRVTMDQTPRPIKSGLTEFSESIRLALSSAPLPSWILRGDHHNNCWPASTEIAALSTSQGRLNAQGMRAWYNSRRSINELVHPWRRLWYQIIDETEGCVRPMGACPWRSTGSFDSLEQQVMKNMIAAFQKDKRWTFYKYAVAMLRDFMSVFTAVNFEASEIKTVTEWLVSMKRSNNSCHGFASARGMYGVAIAIPALLGRGWHMVDLRVIHQLEDAFKQKSPALLDHIRTIGYCMSTGHYMKLSGEEEDVPVPVRTAISSWFDHIVNRTLNDVPKNTSLVNGAAVGAAAQVKQLKQMATADLTQEKITAIMEGVNKIASPVNGVVPTLLEKLKKVEESIKHISTQMQEQDLDRLHEMLKKQLEVNAATADEEPPAGQTVFGGLQSGGSGASASGAAPAQDPDTGAPGVRAGTKRPHHQIQDLAGSF